MRQSKSDAFRPTQLIRQLPVVGSVFNWFLSKDSQKSSNQAYSFDMRSGTLGPLEPGH